MAAEISRPSSARSARRDLTRALSALALKSSPGEALAEATTLIRREFAAKAVGVAIFSESPGLHLATSGSAKATKQLEPLLRKLIHQAQDGELPHSRGTCAERLLDGPRLLGVLVVERAAAPLSSSERRAIGTASATLSAVVRQLRRIESVNADRELLEAETRLYARTAAFKTRDALVRAYAQDLHSALGADVVGIIQPEAGGRHWKVTDWPQGVMAPALEATRDLSNRFAFRGRSPEAYYNPDLRASADSPAERGALAAGQLSFMVAEGKAPGRSPLIVTATSHRRDKWGPEAISAASRIATVLQLSVDRLRTIDTTRAQRERLAAQARLLTSLDPTRPLPEIAETFASELRSRFGVPFVSVVSVGESPPWQVLYLDPSIGPVAEEAITDAAGGQSYQRVLAGETDVTPLDPGQPGTVDQAIYASGVRWLVRAPIRGESDVRGFVTMGSSKPFKFRFDELGDFIRPLGLAFERSGLLSSLARRSDELGLANDILRAVSGTDTIEEICQQVARRLRKHFRADHVAFGQINTSTRERAILGWDSLVLEPTDLPELLSDRDIAAFQDIRHGKAQVLPDLDQEPDLNPWTAVARDAGLQSFIRAPFRVSDDILGLVAVGSREVGQFSGADAELLLEACRPVGLALDRSTALGRIRTFSLQALAHNRLLQELSTDLPGEGIAEHFASVVNEHFGADGVLISRFEEEQSSLRLLAVITDGEPSKATSRNIKLTDPNVREAIMRGRPVLTIDSRGDERFESLRPTAVNLGLRCYMDVPFAGPLGMRGVVSVASRTPGCWSQDDLDALTEFTATLAERLELRAVDQEAREYTRRIESTNRVLSAITGQSGGDLALRFLALASEIVGAEHAIVWQFDEEGSGTPIALKSALVAFDQLPALTSTEFELGWENQNSDVANDVTAESLRARHLPWADLGIRSLLAVKLTANGRTSGGVVLRSKEPGRFTAQHADLLAGLAGPFALALERERALASLAESEFRYRSLVNQAEELICVVDGATRAVLESNAHASRVLDYSQEELQSLRFDEIWDGSAAELEAAFDQVLATGELRLPECYYRRHDGSPLEVEVVASRIQYGGREAVLLLARELSERRSLQRQLLQAQKMESLGTMAGQVAHDFNNLLTTIMGFSGLLRRSTNLSPDQRESLELIEQAAGRGSELTGRLLTFARGGLSEYSAVDLGKVIGDTLKLARPTLHQHIVLEGDFDHSPPLYVEGDGSQLQQALLNIVLNARDAMPGGGVIRVRLARRRQKAIVTISDTGPGMDEDTRLRIFEPFFTTKASGSGTGLGLAITYGIVQGHKGEIRVASVLGEGTTFTILLPLTTAAEPAS